jgi:hypothetical protein
MNFLYVRVLLASTFVASLLAQDPPKALAVPDPSQPAPAASSAPAAVPAAATSPTGTAARTLPATPPGGNRVFGVIPNYRTADASQIGTVLSNREKLSIAARDSFDYPLVALSAALAGIGQWTNQNPSFGQGMKGYGHRWITAYGDQAIGNMFTEGFYPVLFHEDPRYFRREKGSTWSRVGYALSRTFVTYKDAGGTGVNYSDLLGSATVVAIGNAYYPDSRTVGGNASRLGQQLGIDAASFVLKEFWPDIRRKFFHK